MAARPNPETQTIIITGSTRGIGKGLAREFLQRGHNVVITGRGQESVDRAVAELGQPERTLGRTLNVRSVDDNQAVWAAAAERFGRVDMWINNAAIATDHENFGDVDPEQMAATVETNLLGAMYGTRVALAGMLKQGGRGRIYLFEGFGSEGQTSPGLAVYGATKAALKYLVEGLAKEYKDSPVLIGALSPGIVVTDLLISSSKDENPEKWKKSKRILNVLGDRVETVTPWLAEQALVNEEQGKRISWLTRGKAFARFATPSRWKRDIISEAEERLETQGHTGI